MPGFHGQRFFIPTPGGRAATTLLLALIAVETTDLIFALDSIPAIFAVTTDPFIVFTSNAFAILGLRSLYFLLADAADRFRYLKVGLAIVLIFVGGKMLLTDLVQVDPLPSLLVILLIIGVTSRHPCWPTAARPPGQPSDVGRGGAGGPRPGQATAALPGEDAADPADGRRAVGDDRFQVRPVVEAGRRTDATDDPLWRHVRRRAARRDGGPDSAPPPPGRTSRARPRSRSRAGSR